MFDLQIDVVLMKYYLVFDEENNVIFSLRRYWFVKWEKGFKWIGVVYEYLEVYGNFYYSEVVVFYMLFSYDVD